MQVLGVLVFIGLGFVFFFSKMTAGKNSRIKCKCVTPFLNLDLNFNIVSNN